MLPLGRASALVLAALAVHGAIGAVRRYRERRLAERTGQDPRTPSAPTCPCWGSPC